MADFEAVIQRAVDQLTENTPDMRARVYERATAAVVRQLENMKPRPPEVMFQRQIDKLADATRKLEQRYSQYEAYHVKGPDAITPDNVIETVLVPTPDVEPGVAFELSSIGQLEIVPTGFPTDADADELAHLRIGLVNAVEELMALCVGSNSYSHVGDIARRYRATLGSRDEPMSIDLMYVEGIRLENAKNHLTNLIDTGEIFLGSLPVSEALDTVIALNGPTLMSTERGRLLVSRANAYSYDPEIESEYKELALRLAEQLVSNGKLVARNDASQLVDLNREIGVQSNAKRSTQIAHTANSNLLVAVAKYVFAGVSLLAGEAVIQSNVGLTATHELTIFINNAVPFLMAQRQLLLALANAVGNDLSWIDSFLRWLEIQRVAVEIRVQKGKTKPDHF